MRKLAMDELGRKTPKMFKEAKKLPVVLVLENIRSMMNTGSVFRTADAFLIEKIFLCGFTATPPHREIHKTALGSTESVAWKYYQNTIEAIKELKTNGYSIAALEQATNSLNLKEFSPNVSEKYAFVFGNEVKGVSEEVLNMCDFCLEIPQFGTKHSLNVSVTAGMLIWDYYCKIITNM